MERTLICIEEMISILEIKRGELEKQKERELWSFEVTSEDFAYTQGKLSAIKDIIGGLESIKNDLPF